MTRWLLATRNGKEYEFKAKPGDPNRRPPFVAPYQPRIDGKIWFRARCRHQAEYPWTLHFVWKLLHNDRGALSLIANNPFPDAPPHYIRARLIVTIWADWRQSLVETRTGRRMAARALR